MEISKRENIGWVDLLRVVACFLVVFSHCCDPFVAQFDNDRSTFLTGVFSGSFVRACVPLFVMMSGVLLFPVRISMGDFYKKRIGRILIPLIFWSVVLPLLYYIYLNFITTSHSPLIDPENYVFGATLTKIYTFIFNFNYDTTPLWYLYADRALFYYTCIGCMVKASITSRYKAFFICLGYFIVITLYQNGCSVIGIYW